MNNFSKSYVEVLEIMKFFDEEMKNKIPKDIIKNMNDKKDSNYIFKYDYSKPMIEQNISKEAKDILGTLYREYLCSDEEKQKWKEYDRFRLKKMEELKKKKFNKPY